MHADQLSIDDGLARRLVDSQFPAYAALPLTRVNSTGTANAMFRLGQDLALRLPLQPGKAQQVEKEQTWLPRLAPTLPLAVPEPVAQGRPTGDYPSPWSINRWLPGEVAAPATLTDLERAAARLGDFVVRLRKLDTHGAPRPGAHNFFRGVHLATRDASTRAALERCEGLLDCRTAEEAWDAALRVPAWMGPARWIHGDLTPANLLATEGLLSGVIDWGGLGAGDPATDLLPAWNLFTGTSRQVFREAAGLDDHAWARGRGLALSIGLVALPYYLESNPAMATWARGMIDAVLADLAH